ncbi:MAG: response regulator transcription factor [Clostridia bacterium]|nr:response regulator transcription factor [Clostridia bacterium]
MKLLICDDSQITLDLVSLLVDIFEKKRGITFEKDIRTSGDFILEEKNSYDIAIVDVEMPGISGIQLSQRLKEINPRACIIILTAFQNYLDYAMKIQVFRYLSKPLDKNRFFRNLEEAVEEYNNTNKKLTLKSNDSFTVVNTGDILYMEKRAGGTTVVTVNGELEVKEKLEECAELINQPAAFVYSHNSVIVNLQNVVNFDKSFVTLQKNETETVKAYMSQRKYKEFKENFMRFVMGK